MAASYPAGYDTMSDPAANLSGPPLHSTMHNQINDVIEAMQVEFGLNPSGANATVAAAIVALRTGAVPSGALTTFTPTLTQSATPTKTVNGASYQRVGRMITGNVKETVGATPGTANNAIVVGLPVAAAVTTNAIIGSGALWDASVSAWYPVLVLVASSTTATLLDSAAPWVGPLFLGQTGTSMGAAVASGDIVTYSFHYEAAAD